MKRQDNAIEARPLPHLAKLVERLESRANWKDLALPESVTRVQEEIGTHIKHKAAMEDYSRASSAKNLPGTGLTILFSGPSGSGKTLTAVVLAKQFDLPLYRIDLRRVVSKYIGETEKEIIGDRPRFLRDRVRFFPNSSFKKIPTISPLKTGEINNE